MNKYKLFVSVLCFIIIVSGCKRGKNNTIEHKKTISPTELQFLYENFWNKRNPDWKEHFKYDPLISDDFQYLGTIHVNEKIYYHAVYYDYVFYTASGGKYGGPRGTRGVQHALFFDKNYNYLGYSDDIIGKLIEYNINHNKLTIYCEQKIDFFFSETQVYEIANDRKHVIYDENLNEDESD